VSWKLSRTVLRGAVSGNAGRLLDKRLGTKEKQPYNFGLGDDSAFAFAGLWERWQGEDNNVIETCTILTTNPNSLVADVHDRMPVILKTEDYDLWLDPCVTAPNRVTGCLQPFDARLMKKYPVSKRVNRPENDDPACAEETSLPNAPQMLF
jgi:putative SOS response-associated peptidase YedK